MEELIIYNGTAHEITIFSTEDTSPGKDGRKLLLKEGAVPITTIEAGTNLNCSKRNLESPLLNTKIPIVGAIVFDGVDLLPSGYDLYIVSNLYRSAYKELHGDTSKLATINGAVYQTEKDTRPVGCLGLIVG